MWLRAAGRHAALLDRHLAAPPAARRLLEARLGLRGLRRHRRARSTPSAAGPTATPTPSRGCSPGSTCPTKGLIGRGRTATRTSPSPARRSASCRRRCAGGTTGSRASTPASWTSPMLRAWMQEPVPPHARYDRAPGPLGRRGRAGRAPRIKPRRFRLNPGRLDDAAGREARARRRARPQTSAATPGAGARYGLGPDLPADQRAEDGAVAVLRHRAARPSGSRSWARPWSSSSSRATSRTRWSRCGSTTCAPDGASTRVSYGLLNLTHRDSHETPEPLSRAGATACASSSTTSPTPSRPGHRLRVALSTALLADRLALARAASR